jgi:hypothetical protein
MTYLHLLAKGQNLRKSIHQDEEREVRVAVDVEGVQPLDALLDTVQNCRPEEPVRYKPARVGASGRVRNTEVVL